MPTSVPLITRCSAGIFALLATGISAQQPPLVGTPRFEPAVELSLGAEPPDFGRHAVTRLVDWDDDGQDDLLIGAGDGRIWLARNRGELRFAEAEAVMLNDSPLRLGHELTTACYVDLNGDQRKDLLVAHSDNQLSLLVNQGTATRPNFAAPIPLMAIDATTLRLPSGCGGRIDAGDWDGDGDIDLVAGAFSGPIQCYQNCGTASTPRFAASGVLRVGLTEPHYSYNVHPTLFDLNQDGVCDVAYGLNWGTMGLLIAAKPSNSPQRRVATPPTLQTELSPVLSDGRPIDLRAIAGDDATPTFGDLDRDGTLDLVSGGRNGKLFWLRGIPPTASLDRLTTIMRERETDLGTALQRDEKLRNELIGLHQGVYRLCQGFLNTPESRQAIRQWYVAHLNEHARWLKHGPHDLASEPYVPSLAYQTWTILMQLHDGDPDAAAHRRFVADTIGLSGRLREILIEFGTLVIENGRATPNQLETLYSYLQQIPAALLNDRSVPAVTEVITIGEYLGPRLEVLHAGGVNIFANDSGKFGSSENPFPKDFRPCENDYFGVVLAHELNHRVDATRFVAMPKYNERYWKHLRKISGPDVRFTPPSGIGVDWAATKRHFVDQKLWDGQEATWNQAWGDYWLTGPGRSRTRNVCRNETTYTPPRYGIPFFLETRQESIASLANQYFTDSERMLQFALARFHQGSPGCLDEWLLMADVYSLDGPRTYLYRHANGAVRLERTEAPLTRDANGLIRSIDIGNRVYQFTYDADGLVEDVQVR